MNILVHDLDITGIDLPDLLIALHAGTDAIGRGLRHDIGRKLTRHEAETILAMLTNDDSRSVDFDYVLGKPIKVHIDLKRNSLLHADLYDRDCPSGPGSCERIVDGLRRPRRSSP